MHSGQASDDPEAQYQLAIAALLAIPAHDDPPARQATVALTREAAAALTDCAANAAPWEQRDYARRLTQLTTDHPPLAPYTASVQHILTSTLDDHQSG
jgi:hypothetical protein